MHTHMLHALLRSGMNRRPKECSLYNATGATDLLKGDRIPSEQEPSMMVYYNISAPARVKNIIQCAKTKDTFDGLYLPAVHRGASKGHGIIRINLNKVCNYHANILSQSVLVLLWL